MTTECAEIFDMLLPVIIK